MAKRGTGLQAPLQPDEVLAAVVGNKPLARPQVVKKLWEYIKENSLQDAKNKRMINANDKLLPLFNGKKQVNMFEMQKYVGGHLSKI